MVLDKVLKTRQKVIPDFVQLIMATEDYQQTYELIVTEFNKQLKNRPKILATIEYATAIYCT